MLHASQVRNSCVFECKLFTYCLPREQRLQYRFKFLTLILMLMVLLLLLLLLLLLCSGCLSRLAAAMSYVFQVPNSCVLGWMSCK